MSQASSGFAATTNGQNAERPNNAAIWIDPRLGSDQAAGDVTAPLQTLGEAFRRLSYGWTGQARIHLQAGTHAQGTSPKLVIPSPPGGAAAEPIIIDGLSTTDSGLGTLTVGVGSTQGSGAVFGTLVDSVGGLTVNAHRGKFIRFLTGALAGQSLLIMSNTATTFTIVSAFNAAPVAGATYVVETPAALITWVGTMVIEAKGPFGLTNLDFNSAGGIDWQGGTIYQNRLRFPSCTAFQLFENTAFNSLFSFSNLWASGVPVNASQYVGTYFGAGGIFLQCPSRFNALQCLFSNCAARPAAGTSYVVSDSGHVGNSPQWVAQNVVYSALRCLFDTITPIVSGSQNLFFPSIAGGAIGITAGSSAAIFDSIIQNTPSTTAPGDAIRLTDHAFLVLANTSGGGNAGLGVRVLCGSVLKNDAHNFGNSVTGTAGDIQLGANAIQTWAAFGAATQTDPVELCVGKTP